MPEVTNGIFSDYCYDKVWDLFRNHDNEVGSDFKGDKRGRSITDCITYVKKVLIYGHNKINREDVADRVSKTSIPMGTNLALYLVKELNWSAHYWNPDVRDDSRDGTSEHSFSYTNMVLGKSSYYGTPISGTIANYNKVNKSSQTVWIPSGPTIPVANIPMPMPVNVSTDNLAILKKLSQIKFAYGIARGGKHTFLVSYGEIFEVHWTEEGTKLYGKLPFEKFDFLSGALIVPLDSSFTSEAIK